MRETANQFICQTHLILPHVGSHGTLHLQDEPAAHAGHPFTRKTTTTTHHLGFKSNCLLLFIPILLLHVLVSLTLQLIVRLP